MVHRSLHKGVQGHGDKVDWLFGKAGPSRSRGMNLDLEILRFSLH